MKKLMLTILLSVLSGFSFAYDSVDFSQTQVISDMPGTVPPHAPKPDPECGRAKYPEAPRTPAERHLDTHDAEVAPIPNYPGHCLPHAPQSRAS